MSNSGFSLCKGLPLQGESLPEELSGKLSGKLPGKLTEQHSISRSIVMHLLPGVIVTLLYIAFIPVVQVWGFPTVLALFLAVIFGVLPFQFGYVFYQAKKKNGSFSLKGVFAYDRRSPWWQYALVTVLYVAWSVVCFLVLPKFYSGALMENVFFWLPAWFIPGEAAGTSTAAVFVIILAGFLSDIPGAIAEEFYFRGILLPKVAWMGKLAPLFTTFLFAAYHLDSPYKFIERFLSMLPIIYLVWRTKDMKMIIIPHCIVNAIGILLMAAEMLLK
ncbi:MAG TPA: CPBP family intramembrane glutamic endopeptidase [Clostridia bacterium]|nr:CPBP family intramembrane glutamic endopeptidase [Clostridia bacterium]